MKTAFPILRLYFKAGLSITAIPIVTMLILTPIYPTIPAGFFSINAFIFFLMSIAFAFRFRAVDNQLLAIGLSPARRLNFMYLSRALPLGLVAFTTLVLMALTTYPPFPRVYFSGMPFRDLNDSFPNPFLPCYLFVHLAIAAFGTSLLWVDLQARRLAGMDPVDSTVLFIVGQFCIYVGLAALPYLVGLHGPLISRQSATFFLGISLMIVFLFSRAWSTHHLLKNSEVA